jgi:hypothetical protein
VGYRTWMSEAERSYLLSQLPPERWVPPEVGQVHAPNGKDVFVLHGDGGVALIDGRVFSFMATGKAANLFVEYKDAAEVALYESDELFPTAADLKLQPS